MAPRRARKHRASWFPNSVTSRSTRVSARTRRSSTARRPWFACTVHAVLRRLGLAHSNQGRQHAHRLGRCRRHGAESHTGPDLHRLSRGHVLHRGASGRLDGRPQVRRAASIRHERQPLHRHVHGHDPVPVAGRTPAPRSRGTDHVLDSTGHEHCDHRCFRPSFQPVLDALRPHGRCDEDVLEPMVGDGAAGPPGRHDSGRRTSVSASCRNRSARGRGRRCATR